MKALYVLIIILFSFVELSAQGRGNLNNKSQGVNQMKSNSKTVPNAQFPFGQPLEILEQQDRTPKKVFVLGVYASAVHAKWFPQGGGEPLCKSLAVASEPEIFWKGENAAEIISKIIIPQEAGYLEPAKDNNGPSGKLLDELYLEPLGLSRSDVWLCDLVPHSLMNQDQKNAIQSSYAESRKKYSLPEASIPERLHPLKIDDKRRNEIIAELEESQADTIILLGSEPIERFLSVVSDCKKTSLNEFGENTETYGLQHSVSINGKTYAVRPLTHPGTIIRHLEKWERLHRNWVANVNNRKQ
jgi:hypothetical protein